MDGAPVKRFLVQELEGSSAVLGGESLHHLRVLRLVQGDQVELFDGRGRARRGTIASLSEREARIDLGEWREASRPALVTLGQALSKSDRFELVVQKATELGVSRITPLALSRCVVRLDAEKGAERARRWRKIAEEASRQSERSDVPEVEEPQGLASFLLGAKERGEEIALLWEERKEALRLGDWLASRRGRPVALIVGPEGGITEEEAEEARAAGATEVGLGPRILRTETAGIVAAAIALHGMGELG